MSYDGHRQLDYPARASEAVWDGGRMIRVDFKVDLRWNHEGRSRLTDRTQTSEPATALDAYRELLRREDLVGRDVAARFVVAGRSLYFSDFAKPIGLGRIHPDAPIIADATSEEAATLAAWRPPSGETAAGGNFASGRDALLLAQLYEALSSSHGHLGAITEGGAAIMETKARNERALKAAEEAGVLDVVRAMQRRP